MHHRSVHGQYVVAYTEKEARQKIERLLKEELEDYYNLNKYEEEYIDCDDEDLNNE